MLSSSRVPLSLAAMGLLAFVVAMAAEGPTVPVAVGAPGMRSRPLAKEPRPSAEGWNPTTFANVLVGLPKAYYDPAQLPPRRAFLSAMARLEKVVPEVVAGVPDGRGRITLTVRERSRGFATADLKTWMEMGDRLLEVLRWIDSVLRDPARRDALQYAAIKGALDVLDPHTTFYTPEEFRATRSRFTGSVGGVGMYLTMLRGRIAVREVLPRGPAAQAGVRAGDVLERVGELSMANLSPSIAAERLRGKPGTRVLVGVRRAGRALSFSLTRKELVLPSVTTRMLAGRVALLRITGFPKNGLAVFRKALGAIRRRRPRAYLLDLRGNGGGYILQAVRMADFFLESGTLVKAVGRGGQKVVTWKVKRRADRIAEPLVVLVDHRTASAAEILAGALSVAGRAVLLGERTWGKGTVQKLFHMKDGSVLKLTMWQYLLGGDIPVQTAAIVPDVELWPVRIDAQGVSYFSPAHFKGEAGQARVISAMKGAKAWKGRPVMSGVRYLSDAGMDPVLELARQVLRAAKAPARGSLLDVARPLVAKFAATHGAHMVTRLGRRGVDWSAGDGLVSDLKVSLTSSPAEVRAGAPFALHLSVTNRGAKPVARVGAVFSSYASMIDGRELLVGRLGPGQSRTVTLRCKAPPGIRERWERVKVRVRAGGRPDTVEARLLLRVREMPRPSFVMHWLVDDRARGNGDGILDPGESASLAVYVKNVGVGVASQVRVDATEPVAGLRITRARAIFPKLSPGGSAVARLAVRRTFRPDPRGRAPGVTLTLYDRTLGGDLAKTITLPQSGLPARFVAQGGVVAPISDRVLLSDHAGPGGSPVARATTASRLRVEARRGGWYRVALPQERFAFVSVSDVKPAGGAPGGAVRAKMASGAAAQGARSEGVTLLWASMPPALALAPGSMVARAARLEVVATASSPRGVRDAWVRVWNPESVHRAVDKLSYRAAPEGGLTRLSVRATVRLLPGTNYVAVDARGVRGDRAQRRIAVYLPPELAVKERPSAAKKGPKGSAAGARSGARRGCGCSASPEGGGAILLLLAALLRVGRRRRRRRVSDHEPG